MAKEKIIQAELVEATIEKDKLVMVFLDADAGEIREVNFNKNVYNKDTDSWSYDEEKAQKVEEWAQEHFGVSFNEIPAQVGVTKTVYCYDKFNSLFQVEQIAKFDEDMVGQILNGTIKEVKLEEEGIRIFVEYEDEVYRSNMGFTKQIGGKWYQDPIKKGKQIEKFKTKFDVDPSDASAIYGKGVMFEVKKMGGNNAIFIEVKPFPKKKGKK